MESRDKSKNLAMRTIAKILVQAVLTLWQLPQCVMGAFMSWYYGGEVYRYTLHGIYSVWLRCSMRQRNGMSLGCFVILPYKTSCEAIWHEMGHCVQSLILGWLYLPVIGIPSIIHALFHKGGNYRHFYTEKWADSIKARYRFM